MKNIFVGNLTFGATEGQVRTLFEAYGTVDRVNLVTDRDTGQARGFGFVEMSVNAEADRAIAELNGKELDGRALNVNDHLQRLTGEVLQNGDLALRRERTSERDANRQIRPRLRRELRLFNTGLRLRARQLLVLGADLLSVGAQLPVGSIKLALKVSGFVAGSVGEGENFSAAISSSE